MALVAATLSSALQTVDTQMYNAAKDGNPWTSAQYRDAESAAIMDFIKTASVSVPGTGLIAPPTGGPVTGSASGSVS
jgi:hypothetical protein